MTFTPMQLGSMRLADRPATWVRNLDMPTLPPRLIRLPPRDAVRWAYVTSIGSYDITHAPEVMTTAEGWICGPWFAHSHSQQR